MTTPTRSTTPAQSATPPAGKAAAKPAAKSASALPPARRLALLGGALVAVAGAAAYMSYGVEVVDVAPGAAPARPVPAAPAAHAVPNASPNVAPHVASAVAPNAAPHAVPSVGPNAVPDAAPDAAPAAPARHGRTARDSAPIAPDTVVIEREVYGYGGGDRRDPFRPLIVTTVLRPFPNELKLVAVAYDPRGTNSVAILRDITTKAQHRVRPGQLVGRMRVVRIDPKAVVFVVEELGFSRRETLTLQDSLGSRQP